MTTPIVTRKRLSVVTSPYFSTSSITTKDAIASDLDSKNKESSSKKLKREQIKIEYEEEKEKEVKKLDGNNKKQKNKKEEKINYKEEVEETEHNNKIKTHINGVSLAKINWREVWDKIKIMRSENLAPVDTLGAESFNQSHIDPIEKRFHILVGCLLSSQTKDAITHAAVTRLKEYGLTVDSILKIDTNKLETLLYPVGFYKRKAIYLKKIAEILKTKYNGDIPPTFKEIEQLPGIGPKMTNLIVQIAWGRVEGIAVDVHMHRISNRLGWVKTKTPEETMRDLESWLPKENWGEVNHLLVGFGQTICTPVNPK
ncbi:hypothetical protein RB653_003021 [Dictyostelium firmibasis]|uniref:Endonuclease III homolog n=1 Tax=Dictyostelium firmibasis TaxID=79012 RepID=A0AAN7TRL7_9MYCE